MINTGHYLEGIRQLWWFAFSMLLVWIFTLPHRILGKRIKKDSPLDSLKNLYVNGELSAKEYKEWKRILEFEMKD